MTKQRMGVWVAGATMAATALLAGCSGTSTTSTEGPAVTAAPGSTAAGTSPTTVGTTPKGTTPKGTSKPTGTTTQGGSDATSEFCTQIKAADEMTKATSGSTQKSKPTQQDITNFTDALAAARDAGPAEVKDSLDTLIEAYDEFAKIADDPTKEDQALTIFLNDKVMNAGTKLETVVKDQCGFELKTGGSSSSTTDGTDPSVTIDPSESPTSISSVKAAIKTKAGNLSWAPAINGGSWGYSGDGTTYDWTVEADSSGRALSADSAFDACTMIAEYLQPLQPSFSLQIKSSDGTTLAEKTASGTSCKKV